MTRDELEAFVRRHCDDFVNHADPSCVERDVSPSIVDYNPLPGQPQGLDGVRWIIEFIQRNMSGLTVTVEHVVADGDQSMGCLTGLDPSAAIAWTS